jgi:hypothetical protein
MPGHVLEHVAFVYLHGIGDLGAYWIDCCRIERLNDLLGLLHIPERSRLSDGEAVVVVSSVAFAAQLAQLPPAVIVSLWPALDRHSQR